MLVIETGEPACALKGFCFEEYVECGLPLCFFCNGCGVYFVLEKGVCLKCEVMKMLDICFVLIGTIQTGHPSTRQASLELTVQPTVQSTPNRVQLIVQQKVENIGE